MGAGAQVACLHGSIADEPLDAVWLVQRHHGPFTARRFPAPDNAAAPVPAPAPAPAPAPGGSGQGDKGAEQDGGEVRAPCCVGVCLGAVCARSPCCVGACDLGAWVGGARALQILVWIVWAASAQIGPHGVGVLLGPFLAAQMV